MIISASRRTDIPAFYTPWLLHRLAEGFVDVQNPMNRQQIFRVPLCAATVDCLAFWTKNPLPLLGLAHSAAASPLEQIQRFGFPCFFQFTLTPYDTRLERHLPPKDALLNAFKELSRRLGKEKVLWRYDPVIITESTPAAWHIREFSRLAEALAGYTEQCIFSFVSLYGKFSAETKATLGGGGTLEQREAVVQGFASAAAERGIHLSSCCDTGSYHKYGVSNHGCLSLETLTKVLGKPVVPRYDKNQRPGCRCLQSVDIGAYDTCLNGCVYCYANRSEKRAQQSARQHDPRSSLLIGHLPEGVLPKERTLKSIMAAPAPDCGQGSGQNGNATAPKEKQLTLL